MVLNRKHRLTYVKKTWLQARFHHTAFHQLHGLHSYNMRRQIIQVLHKSLIHSTVKPAYSATIGTPKNWQCNRADPKACE